jgi:hypothetical protein
MKALEGRKFVYVFGPKTGPQKIGIAKNFGSRLSQYKSHNTQKIRQHFVAECREHRAAEIEKLAHSNLKNFRDHGEWYSVSPEIAVLSVKMAMADKNQPLMTFAKYRRSPAKDRYQISICTDDKLDKMQPVALIDTWESRQDDNSVRHVRLNMHEIDELWEFAPKRYRKDHISISEAFEYVEEYVWKKCGLSTLGLSENGRSN